MSKLPTHGITGPPTRAKFVPLCGVILACGLLVGKGIVGDAGAWLLLAALVILARFVL
jgi:hypothetical protein